MYLSRRAGAAPGYGDCVHPGGIGGINPGNGSPGNGNPGSGSGGIGNDGIGNGGNSGGENAGAAGGGGAEAPPGESRLPIRPPTPGIADATPEMIDASGPNP
jgi:hypothetical protein